MNRIGLIRTLTWIGAAVVLTIVIRFVLCTVYVVPDESMSPTLLPGDRVLVCKWSYGLRTGDDERFAYNRWGGGQIHKGDIVLFNLPQRETDAFTTRPKSVGRVVAMPGDTVDIRYASYYIPQSDPHCESAKNELIVIRHLHGDRLFIVPRTHIIGRAQRVLYRSQGLKIDYHRILKSLR